MASNLYAFAPVSVSEFAKDLSQFREEGLFGAGVVGLGLVDSVVVVEGICMR